MEACDSDFDPQWCIHMSLVCYVWITHITTQCHAGRSAALPPCFSAKAASFRTHRMLIGLVFSATASRTCPDWLRAGLCADEMQIQSGAGKRLTPRSEMAIHLQRKGHRSSYDESAYLLWNTVRYSLFFPLQRLPISFHFQYERKFVLLSFEDYRTHLKSAFDFYSVWRTHQTHLKASGTCLHGFKCVAFDRGSLTDKYWTTRTQESASWPQTGGKQEAYSESQREETVDAQMVFPWDAKYGTTYYSGCCSR